MGFLWNGVRRLGETGALLAAAACLALVVWFGFWLIEIGFSALVLLVMWGMFRIHGGALEENALLRADNTAKARQIAELQRTLARMGTATPPPAATGMPRFGSLFRPRGPAASP
jgi:hypothetical protein